MITPRAQPVTFALTFVAEHFGVTVDDLIRDDRVEPLTGIRKIAYTVARHATGSSYTQIATIAQRHHSSILSTIRHLRGVAKENEWVRTTTATLILKVIEAIGADRELFMIGGLPSVQALDLPSFSRVWPASYPQLSDEPLQSTTVNPADDGAISSVERIEV